MVRTTLRALALIALAGCGASTKETYTREDVSEMRNYPAPPAGYKKVRAAVMPFKQAMNPASWWACPVGPQAGEQFETIVSQSDRFQLIERLQLDNLMKEQGLQGVVDSDELARPGKIRGVDYLFLGAITEFSMETNKTRFDSGFLDRVVPGLAPLEIDSAKAVLKTTVGVDVKLVNTTTGEIVVKDAGRVVKEQTAKAWGVRVFGAGGSAKNEIRIDADGQGKILRHALDESYRKLLPVIDSRFSREQPSYCPHCKTELAKDQKFCTKCGKGAEASKCGKCGARLEANAKFCGGCGGKVEGAPAPAGGSSAAPGGAPAPGAPAGSGDYLPENTVLAYDGYHWFACVMKTPPAGEKKEAEFVSVNKGHSFFAAKYHTTRPATAADIKVGVTVYVPWLGRFGEHHRSTDAIRKHWKHPEMFYDASTVTGVQGIEGGVFQAPADGNKDMHVSNVRVSVP